MPKVLISDAMDNVAEKILASNNIEVDVKTDFTPEELIKNTKFQRWAGVQVIKAALGIPIIPGR